MKLLAVVLLLLCACSEAFLHPAYEDLQTESEERCAWCMGHLEPMIKDAIRNSSSTDNTKDTLDNALQAILKATETDDEAEMIREEVEHIRWNTIQHRQVSALQTVYHWKPTYRNYFDRLVDHVICACKVLEVLDHEKAMHRLLQYHAQAVRKESMDHGWPEGMSGKRATPIAKGKKRRNRRDEL